MVITTTERLSIRVPRLEDAEWLLELNNDPLWVQFCGNWGVHSLDDAAEYASNCRKHTEYYGHGLWVVEHKQSAAPVGVCGLLTRGIFIHPDLGYGLLKPYRGQGIAKEAAMGVIDWARHSGKFTHLTAMAHVDNYASQSLLARLGFEREGKIFLKNVFDQYLFRATL
ncbi:N-acetyltransferase [Alteromonas aestuariivivens]|uniref:N-acetyltransferase n=1 Tax=Alteromonas aestuariivivens TaxID=1938339 RepID=A0A3D8MCP7_9ALTE|nr:GNAT family N-acetyltransferase [Alteromonas aestuariivivens]RDV28010.1 N-acetyltransferase [Alteromonas aestuariivivens]